MPCGVPSISLPKSRCRSETWLRQLHKVLVCHGVCTSTDLQKAWFILRGDLNLCRDAEDYRDRRRTLRRRGSVQRRVARGSCRKSSDGSLKVNLAPFRRCRRQSESMSELKWQKCCRDPDWPLIAVPDRHHRVDEGQRHDSCSASIPPPRLNARG